MAALRSAINGATDFRSARHGYISARVRHNKRIEPLHDYIPWIIRRPVGERHQPTRKVTMQSIEQDARDLLERMGFEDAQSFSSGDLVELANLLAELCNLDPPKKA